ncbi:hypothetical protein GCM10027037_23970 [Mucilaginibacter koreensis]
MSESLNSVLGQTYTNWECIIINDGSTDDSEHIVQNHLTTDNRFKYIKQKNGGLSNARNNGIKASTGIYIQLLDADDTLEPNKLEQNLKVYDSVSEAESTIVYSSMRYFEDNDPSDLKILGRSHFIAHIELKEDDNHKSQQELLLQKNPFVVSAPLYPSAVFERIGLFDESLKALEDWDFNIRCSIGGYKFHHFYANSALTHIRLHDKSMMRNQKLLDENYYTLQLRYSIASPIITEVKQPSMIKKIIKQFIPPILIQLLVPIKKQL